MRMPVCQSKARSQALSSVDCRQPTRRSERRSDADQALGIDALLSLASEVRDDSGPADGESGRHE